MRVKLSYTVEEEELLQEVAHTLRNKGQIIQQIIVDWNKLIETLEKSDDFNVVKFRENIDLTRRQLASLDFRVAEAGDVVDAYHRYQEGLREVPTPSLPEAADTLETIDE